MFLELPPGAITVVEYGLHRRHGKLFREVYNTIGGH